MLSDHDDGSDLEESGQAFGLRIVAEPEPDFDVWPENWTACMVFRRVRQQWQVAPSGHVVCLNWAAVQDVMDAMGIKGKKRLRMIDQINIMQAAGLKHLNEA